MIYQGLFRGRRNLWVLGRKPSGTKGTWYLWYKSVLWNRKHVTVGWVWRWMAGHVQCPFWCFWAIVMHPTCVNAVAVYDELPVWVQIIKWLMFTERHLNKASSPGCMPHINAAIALLAPPLPLFFPPRLPSVCPLICSLSRNVMKLLYKHIKGYCILLSPRQSNISPRLGVTPAITQTVSEADETNQFNKLLRSFRACSAFYNWPRNRCANIIRYVFFALAVLLFSHRAMLTQGFGRRGQNKYWWRNLNNLLRPRVSHQKMEVVRRVCAPLIAKMIRKLVQLCSDWPPWAGNVCW